MCGLCVVARKWQMCLCILWTQYKFLLKAELGTGLPKAEVSSVTGLGNLVRDRASREKLDIVLTLEPLLWIPVQNIYCGTRQLCASPKVSGKWVIYLDSTQFQPGWYFLPELVESDTGRMITQQQLLMCIISIRYFFSSIGGDFWLEIFDLFEDCSIVY